ncbi:hypothetical protein RUND412_009297 [Rhizina undulata]
MANNRLITGAYIIRLKKTPFAVDIDDMNRAYVCELDAHKRRENQVWWVEPLPHYEDDADARKNGRVYTITNVATNKCLDLVDGLAAERSEVSAVLGCGLPWQKWRIRRVEDSDGDYYTLTNFHTGTVLDFDIQTGKGRAPGRCYCRNRDTPSTTQRWEFVVPLVAVPPGWIQIQNSSNNRFLQQTYATLPPFLAEHPVPSKQSCYRETWGAQWAFIHPPNHGGASTQTCWLIKNRLTGGLLGFREQVYKNSKKRNVHANEVVPTSDNALQWSVEADTEGRWEIVNQEVKYPLMAGVIRSYVFGTNGAERENDVGCFEVSCPSQAVPAHLEGFASWLLTRAGHKSKTLGVSVPPPAYELHQEDQKDGPLA